MENVVHRLTLDLTAPDVFPRVEVQRDNARTLAVSLTQGGRPYWIAEGVTAVFSARKPDGNPLFNGCTVEKNRIVYDFTDQTTNVPGVVECEILLYSGDERILASPRFEIMVEDLIHQEGDVPESAPELNALTQMVSAGTALMEDVRAALGELGDADAILDQAETAAKNAEYSAQRAETAQAGAEDATSKALAAAESANRNIESLGIINLYVCSEGEYTADGPPTISEPDEETTYLVPQDSEGILYASWVYANGVWEFVETLTVTLDETEGGKGQDGKDGADGKDGKDGADGVGISSIRQTTVSTADGGNNVFTVTLTNGTSATFTVKNGTKGSEGAAGINGKDGKTPVKGTDYFTDADKTEMVNAVIAALPVYAGEVEAV